jgi:hypothetical protein
MQSLDSLQLVVDLKRMRGKGQPTLKKKKKSPYIQRAPHTSFIALASPVPRPELSGYDVHLAAKTGRVLAKALRER